MGNMFGANNVVGNLDLCFYVSLSVESWIEHGSILAFKNLQDNKGNFRKTVADLQHGENPED